MSSGLTDANSSGVEPMYRIDGQGGDGRGAPPSRTMYASRKTTWPLKAETKLLTPVHDRMTRSSRTAPVVGLTLSRPKNFWRAAIVLAGRGRDSFAFTGAVTKNDKPTIATDNVRLRIFLLLFLVYGSRSWSRSISVRCSLRPLPRTAQRLPRVEGAGEPISSPPSIRLSRSHRGSYSAPRSIGADRP